MEPSMSFWYFCNVLHIILLVLSSQISATFYYPYYNYYHKQPRTKCAYSLVVNEISGSKCPELMQKLQADQAPANLRSEGPANNAGMADTTKLREELRNFEGTFYKEMSRLKDLNMTLKLQQDSIDDTQKYVKKRNVNATVYNLRLKSMETKVTKQWNYIKDLESKVLDVMTSLGELNVMLDKRLPKLNALDTKVIEVESAAKVKNCGLGKDTKYYRDCLQVYLSGHRKSGIYYVTPIYSACPIPVWCDHDTPGGGWLVLQRRKNNETSFDRTWLDYRGGFGDLTKNFWLGNDNIFMFTNQDTFRLRVDLWDFKGSRVFAEYERFIVDGERTNYRLHIGNYSGTAGEGLLRHDGADFSTPDNDNDVWEKYHCAKQWGAGWWFTNCWFAFLNGMYMNTSEVQYRGLAWNDWNDEQLFASEMKIIPIL